MRIRARIHNGLIQPLEKLNMTEGTEVVITIRGLSESVKKENDTEEQDWMDDPVVLDLLAKREKQVAEEVRRGDFTTLEDLQAELGA